jgi:chromate reductase
MSVLCFAGSLRRESLNKKNVRIAHEIIGAAGVASELVDLADYPMPVFDQDIQEKGFPDSVVRLGERVKGAAALVVSCPEYNGSISSPLKNTVDWLSRLPGDIFSGKKVLLIGASPGILGANVGLWHSRRPFEKLKCFVFPEMLGLPKAHEAFDERGAFKDKASHERLAKLVSGFLETL